MAHFSYYQSTFFLFLVISMAMIEVSTAGKERSFTSKDCPTACEHRCSKTHHKKPCLFFCNKCCSKCLCVPPGTSGHKEECPCYNQWKTKEGAPKCP